MRPNETAQADSLEAELTAEELELLDRLAEGIASRKLTSAAIFFLESLKPLNFVGASMLVFLRPMISLVWNNPATYDRVVKLLEHRGAIEVFLRRLEAVA